MLLSIRLYLRLWMPTFWPYDTGCGERREKKTWSPLSFIIRFLRERMTRFANLGKEKYRSWMVTAVVSLLGDSKESNFRNSLVSCHVFHDSAVVVCVLNAYRRIQTSGSVCCCVCHTREFVLVAVLSCSYLSFCLFGSTDLVAQLSEVQQILPPYMS